MLLLDSSKYDLALQLKACQSNRRRRGKVARLPSDLRHQINRMLDDGFPYKTIIQKLGDAAKHLNEDNLTNWRQGGYQDYLKTRAISERAQTQIETAADLVRHSAELRGAPVREVVSRVALLSYLDTLLHHGDHLAAQAMQRNPAKMITLMNTICNLSNAGLQLEKLKNPPRGNLSQPSTKDPQPLPHPSEVNRA